MTWPSKFPTFDEHWCSYKRVQGTTNRLPKLITWIDKCRCGRVIQVQSTAAGISKTWYDREGKLERVTGTDKTAQSDTVPVNPPTDQRVFDSKNEI